MKFKKLTTQLNVEPQYIERLGSIDIKGIAYDSRKVEKGFIFFSIKGYKTDGHSFVEAAVNNGASIIIVEKNRFDDFKNCSFINKIVPLENTRKALAVFSKAYFNNPSDKMKVIGVTGTNGKTTITYMVKEIVEAAGQECGVIGTIAYYIGKEKVKAPNTTPESYELYKLMNLMVEKGCSTCVMEVSSHALYLNRVEGIDFDAVIFTNLSEDHLDFHLDMKEYLNAKLLIIEALDSSGKQNKLAILNNDSHVYKDFELLVNELNVNYVTYGLSEKSDYKAIIGELSGSKNEFSVDVSGENKTINLGLLGDFNIYNALAVVAAMDFLDFSVDAIVEGLERVSVPGRFQNVPTKLPFTVIIDYAHTDDALKNVLETIIKLKPGRIICVFGCGGDRETGKRYLMGEVSTELADLTVITSDNPRTENPERILDMIEEGAKRNSGKYLRILNRENAIEYSIKNAKPGDIVLIAGKGHEDYQILKDRTIHFDDTEIAEKFLKIREKESNIK